MSRIQVVGEATKLVFVAYQEQKDSTAYQEMDNLSSVAKVALSLSFLPWGHCSSWSLLDDKEMCVVISASVACQTSIIVKLLLRCFCSEVLSVQRIHY